MRIKYPKCVRLITVHILTKLKIMRTNARKELAEMSTEELKDLRDLHYAGTWIPFNYNYVLDELEDRYSESDAMCGHDLDEDYGY